VFYNTGAADFPFERQGNAFIERGCIDRDSIVKLDNGTFFVGDDRIVYKLDGYTPCRVSTHAVEKTLSEASWFRGFTYTQRRPQVLRPQHRRGRVGARCRHRRMA
jgi:hypothetical protein